VTPNRLTIRAAACYLTRSDWHFEGLLVGRTRLPPGARSGHSCRVNFLSALSGTALQSKSGGTLLLSPHFTDGGRRIRFGIKA